MGTDVVENVCSINVTFAPVAENVNAGHYQTVSKSNSST